MTENDKKDIDEKTTLLVGLEIHITVKSKKKIFNWESNYEGNVTTPNSVVGPWELGYPGYLPIINPEVIEIAIKLASHLKMKIADLIIFDRKIYNFRDLPKGYQITQKRSPFAKKGLFFMITEKGEKKKIPIESIHLEEDTAKSYFDEKNKEIKLDFNRSGNPLIELVTKPVFKDENNLFLFLKQFQQFLIYLNISEAKLEKGQIRIDVNYSIKISDDYISPRYEIKNLNSFNNIKIALNEEKKKHFKLYEEKKKPPKSSTLGFNEKEKKPIVIREKKKYFFIPEFNIPPIRIEKKNIEKYSNKKMNTPFFYWKKINSFCPERSLEILKHPLYPFFLKSLEFLRKKNQKKVYEKKDLLLSWINFYFNFLSPLLKENNEIFEKKWRPILLISESLEKKIFDGDEVKKTLQEIIQKNKGSIYIQSLIKKKVKKQEKTKIDFKKVNNFIEKRLSSLWTEELEKDFKKKEKKQKVFNYLFGKIKKEFSEVPAEQINLIINCFAKKKSIKS